MAKVTFDGVNKLIKVNSGITEIDVKVDLYSDWKEWIVQSDNSKYLPAMAAIGGDQISSTKFLGTTFFLENGWKIKPYGWNHTLTISGNLYSRDGSSPFVSADGSYNIAINMTTSNIIDTISTSGGGTATVDNAAIASAVWNKLLTDITTTSSIGLLMKSMEKKIDDTQAIVESI